MSPKICHHPSQLLCSRHNLLQTTISVGLSSTLGSFRMVDLPVSLASLFEQVEKLFRVTGEL